MPAQGPLDVAAYRAFCAAHVRAEMVEDERGLHEMLDVLRELGVKEVSLDIETGSLSPMDGPLRLVQVGVREGGVERQWLVDAFQVDLTPLGPLMRTTRVCKNVHYSPFEAKWLMVQMGVPLNNVFDTWAAWREIVKALDRKTPDQVRALVPDLAESARIDLGVDLDAADWATSLPRGLSHVVHRLLGFHLAKHEQTGDWTEPLLTASQRQYAATDVAVLPYVADEARELMRRLSIKPGRLEGLRRWAIQRNMEEDGLDRTVHQRDQMEDAQDLILSAHTEQALEEAMVLARMLCVTARNRAALWGLADMQRETFVPQDRLAT